MITHDALKPYCTHSPAFSVFSELLSWAICVPPLINRHYRPKAWCLLTDCWWVSWCFRITHRYGTPLLWWIRSLLYFTLHFLSIGCLCICLCRRLTLYACKSDLSGNVLIWCSALALWQLHVWDLGFVKHIAPALFWSYKCGKVSFKSISLGCVVLTFGWGVSGGWEVEESVTQFSSIVGVKSLRWCSSWQE